MKIKVQMTKTVQEKQYEPIQISVGLEFEATKPKFWEKEMRKAQGELEEVLDEMIEDRLNR